MKRTDSIGDVVESVPNRRDIYPWPDWLNGQAYRVQHGEHFSCSVVGFRSVLYSRAKREGMTVNVSSDEATGEVFFQFKARESDGGESS